MKDLFILDLQTDRTDMFISSTKQSNLVLKFVHEFFCFQFFYFSCVFMENFSHRLQFLLRFHSVQNHEVPDGGEDGQGEEAEAGADLANRVQIREVTEITCIVEVFGSGPVQSIAAHCGINGGHACSVSGIRGKVSGARGAELE